MPSYNWTKLVAIFLGFLLGTLSRPDSMAQSVDQETVTAAMTLRILNFTEWPEERPTVTIGIYEDTKYYEVFSSITAAPAYQDRYRIVLLTDDVDETISKLDAVFFPRNDPREIARFLLRLGTQPVVSIGAFEGFLEEGGMVGLVTRQKRISFEIYPQLARDRGIIFRAKLLRLAQRIKK